MKFKKIKTKLILAIVGCSLVASLSVGGVSLYSSSQNIYEEATAKLQYETKNIRDKLSSQMEIVETSSNQLSKVSEIYINNEREWSSLSPAEKKSITDALNDLVVAYGKSTPSTLSTYIMMDYRATNEVVMGWGSLQNGEFKELNSPTTLEDYKVEYDKLSKSAGSWTDVYYDENLKKQMISYISPIEINGTKVGIAGFDIDLDLFINTVKAVKIYESGYGYLLESDSSILYHPAIELGTKLSEYENGAHKNLADYINSHDEGIYDYRYQNEDKVTTFEKLPNGWVIATAPKYDEMFANLKETSNTVMLIVFLSAVLFSALGYFLSVSIARPIAKLRDAFVVASSGDLSVTVPVKSEDEIGVASNQFNVMMGEMSTLVGQIQDSCTTVQNASVSLSHIATTTNEVFNEIASSMESISSSATSQAQGMEELMENSRDLGDEIDTLDKNALAMNELSLNVSSQSQKGLETLKSLVSTTTLKMEKSEEIDLAVQANHKSAQEIEGILETVVSIAKQTNLLALNASIEAARAGEHGRGFTVVAEEVKKLAEESTASVEEVKTYISAIQQQSAHAVAVLEGIKSLEAEQSDLVEKTDDVFSEILKELNRLTERIASISENSRKMARHKNQSMSMIETMSSGSEEVAASTQEISSATEEGASSLEEVASLVEQMVALIGTLNLGVAKFKR